MPSRRRKAEAEEEAEEVYHVEVITKARVSEEGEWEYLVKWAGYESDADSWEPTANVRQCDRLLASFWRHVGTDDNDYPIGYEIAAEEDWINKEKRYFQETFVKPSKRRSEKPAKTDSQERRKSKSNTPLVSESTTSDDYESSEEEPSAKSNTIKELNRKTRIVDTESESGSDGQLRKQAKAAFRQKAVMPASKQIPKVPTRVKRQELPSATDGSISIAPPKVTAVRTHQDQKANPLVKSMRLPSDAVGAGSLLSTKQRVAAGIPPPTAAAKPLLLLPKKSLPSLSFKKIKPVILPQTKETTTASTSFPTLASPVIQTTIITDDVEMAASPQPMDIDEPGDLWGSISDDAGPSVGGSENFSVPIPPKSQEEIDADKFLQTIHIPGLSDPLEMLIISEQPNQSATELTKTLTISKIPRKWKWSGDLFINISKSRTELLCAVTIGDPSGTSNTSHINLLLSSLDSLLISKLYPIMDLSPLLRACGKPQYFGILESNEPSEEVTIHGLKHHLTSEGLAAAIPLFLDSAEAAAVLIIFPSAQQGLTKVLQVPEPLLSGGPILVVLFPFLVSAMTSTGQRSIETVMQSSSSTQIMSMLHEPFKEATFYQAISLLCFPKALLDFLNSSSTRLYCIWPSPDQMSPGLDTPMLQHILKSTKAVSAKLEEDVRVVFISNQYLDVLHTMPSLVTKLANSPEIQFWTYGYSTSLACQGWKVQEIYPLGGIVTFTSSALTEDLVGCHQLMSQIIEHPLWDCYLIPEVLAVSHLLSSDGHQDSSSELYLGPILDFVDLGLISVIRMPPQRVPCSPLASLPQIFNHPTSTSKHELLEVYLQGLRSHPATLGMTAEQLITFTNNEITKDLLDAQIQPVFMENYRRFVVIRAPSEDTIPFDKDGLEWSSLSLFSFKDDYFQP